MDRRPRLPGIEGALGGAILVLRWLRDWTQEDLAEAAGISAGTVSNYESGTAAIPQEALAKIAGAFRIPLSALERLAAAVQGAADGMEPSAIPGERAGLAAAIAAELAEDFRTLAFPVVLAFLSSLSVSGREGQAASPDEARRAARSVWECLDSLGTDRLPSLAAALPEILTWALCERLAEESEAAASDDTDRALDLAKRAVWVAERVAPEDSPLTCQGFAWAFAGNARRVKSRLRTGEKAFALSARLWREGATIDPGFLDGARRLDLEASLCIDQRRLPEARRLLAGAAAEARTDLARGRVLIKDAYALELAGDYQGAVTALGRASGLIAETETRLRCVLRFNLMTNLVHLGRAAEAEPMLADLRRLAAQIGNGLDGLRLRWLEGRIAAGVGRTAEAIEALSRVRAEFSGKKIHYDEALAGMELAALYLQQGRTADVKSLVRQMAPVFRDQGVPAEARKALDLFRRAVELETVTLDLARRLAAYLYRVQGSPELRFEP